uniref:Uncharacterized protein n=1 Tax=Heterorhabditis bacteriophora TaxID=37862 RepID=A0A1I7X9N7_HETBA
MMKMWMKKTSTQYQKDNEHNSAGKFNCHCISLKNKTENLQV